MQVVARGIVSLVAAIAFDGVAAQQLAVRFLRHCNVSGDNRFRRRRAFVAVAACAFLAPAGEKRYAGGVR